MVTRLTGHARWRLVAPLVLAFLAVLAYLPAQFLPLISDDYEQISVSRKYGGAEHWDDLLRDPLYRCRAVSIVLTYWVEKVAGIGPAALSSVGLLWHILNTFLVASLGLWSRIGWRISLPAAAFFAVAEGHQEAVIWYAAIPELNVFAFTLIAFLCWVRWLDDPDFRYYVGAFAAFVLALFSKESAVALVGLQVIAILLGHTRRVRAWTALIPFGALAAVYFAWGYVARTGHLHYNDGTFSLHAPFVLTLLNSLSRMFWFWGFLSVIVLLVLWRSSGLRFVAVSLAFAAVALLPYSFLTYMPRVPSRHTYLASAALALVVGAAFTALRPRVQPRSLAALAAVVVLHNCGYLWTYKQKQFAERAKPTVDLIEVLRSTDGPVMVECFPYSKSIAHQVALIAVGTDPNRLVFRDAADCSGHKYTSVAVASSFADGGGQ